MNTLQVLAIGLGLAGYYALVAVGFALIFATVRIFHIAHGTVFITAGYLFFFLHRVHGIGLVPSGLLAVAVAALLGLAIDKAVYLPVLRRGGGMFSVFIASLGVSLIFEAGFLAYTKGVVSVARTDMLDILTAGPVAVRSLDLAVLAVVGVNVDRTRTHIFLLASALAGVAGVLTAYDMGIGPETGTRTFFVAVVAVILGGLRNLLLGTIIGSVALGILTAYAGFFFPEWVTFSVFITMILLILIRPQGLFG